MGSSRFWLCKEGDAHGALVAKGRALHQATNQWRATLRYYLSLYEEILYDSDTVSERSVYKSSRRSFLRHTRRDLNITRSIADAARAEAETSTRVAFVTDGGSWRLQRQAEKREMFCAGEFRRMKWPALKSKMVGHAGIFGTSIGKVYRAADRTACALVHPWNFYVDDGDGSHGDPRAVYERALIDRYVLAAEHPKHRDAILRAPAARLDGMTPGDASDDRVEVWEGTRLPSAPGRRDGRHCLGVYGASLLDEPWERDYFPYLVLYFKQPVVGFWGYGICELLATVQESISRAEKQIESANWLHGAARMWAKKGSVDAARISNEPGTLNEYNDVPPTMMAGNILSPEIYADRQSQIDIAYTLSGVSGTNAQNIKPAGINSGKALRMFNDLASKPLMPFLKACEQLDVDCAMRVLDLAADIYRDTGEYVSKAVRREGLLAVDFSDIGDSDDFEIEAFPVSALSRTPAGRLADVEELIESGMAAALGWEPAELLDMLDIPDLRAQGDLVKAPLMLIRQRIESILDGDDPVAPTEGINTKLAMKLCVLYLQKAENMADVDNESKDNLRSWYAQVVALDKAEQAASAAPAMPAPGAPSPEAAMAAGPEAAMMGAPPGGGMPGAGAPLDLPAPGALVDGTPQQMGVALWPSKVATSAPLGPLAPRRQPRPPPRRKPSPPPRRKAARRALAARPPPPGPSPGRCSPPGSSPGKPPRSSRRRSKPARPAKAAKTSPRPSRRPAARRSPPRRRSRASARRTASRTARPLRPRPRRQTPPRAASGTSTAVSSRGRAALRPRPARSA